MSPDRSSGSIEVDRAWKRFRSDAHAHRGRRMADTLLGRRGDEGDRWRWALRDVAFTVAPGESVGIVGRNGSGKSTLLKLVNGTMDPTAGRVSVQGQVGALIELQAGLHPELTGRENALAYGALLGLSRKRAAAGLDQVMAFAGIEDAVDRQVKLYSTGMRLRLGFAIASHLEAPVLLVDEVLAVADAEFQRKGHERLAQLKASGTTIVYVSHDLPSVERTCDRAVWLDGGLLRADGPTHGVLAGYRETVGEAAGP
jgi:ABC-type polysaccharide/polyol phosphate transport system ATPase subunit